MTTIRIHKAQGTTRSDEVESLTIEIHEVAPRFDTIFDQDELFEQDAKVLAGALSMTLPGGLFNRLLSDMLIIKAGSLRVPLFDPNEF